MNRYEAHLDKNQANYTPLSPLSFLQRAGEVYPDLPSIVHGSRRYTWSKTLERCTRLASALASRQIGTGDTVSVIAPNIPEMFEVHYAIPMCGAVLNTINTRLDASTIAHILQHGGCRVLLVDREFSLVAAEALAKIDEDSNDILIIDIEDSELGDTLPGKSIGSINYEDLLNEGSAEFKWSLPEDEWQAISLNYTSGTTGNPKGVVYHHRGAYLNAVSNISSWTMPHQAVYLWTLPMFHCNGWCFPWSLAAIAGTSICMREVSAANIYKALAEHHVTHLCGAAAVII